MVERGRAVGRRRRPPRRGGAARARAAAATRGSSSASRTRIRAGPSRRSCGAGSRAECAVGHVVLLLRGCLAEACRRCPMDAIPPRDQPSRTAPPGAASRRIAAGGTAMGAVNGRVKAGTRSPERRLSASDQPARRAEAGGQRRRPPAAAPHRANRFVTSGSRRSFGDPRARAARRRARARPRPEIEVGLPAGDRGDLAQRRGRPGARASCGRCASVIVPAAVPSATVETGILASPPHARPEGPPGRGALAVGEQDDRRRRFVPRTICRAAASASPVAVVPAGFTPASALRTAA